MSQSGNSYVGLASAPRVDIWFLALDIPAAEREALLTVLSVDERARADRFHRALDRRRWIAARGQMRERLSAETGIAAQDLVFRTDDSGRPFLANATGNAFDFNLSHAEGWAALAVSWQGRAGVDIEALRAINPDEEAFALAASEAAHLTTLAPAERQAAFFRYWTLKESFLKAIGTGLALPLQSFAMTPDAAGPARLERWENHEDETSLWHFSTASPQNGYCAAAASTGTRPSAYFWHMPCTLKG